MHAVVETPPFLADARVAGIADEERHAIITLLAHDPKAGIVMAGTGGARKLRFKRPGMGKSRGYRTIFYFAGEDLPVFLLNVFVKGDKANLSRTEQSTLRSIPGRISDACRGET